jgi:hypothetical protein
MSKPCEVEELFSKLCPRLLAESRASLQEFMESVTLPISTFVMNFSLMHYAKHIPLLVKYVAENAANWAARPELTGALAEFCKKHSNKVQLETLKKAQESLGKLGNWHKTIAGAGCVLSVLALVCEVNDVRKLHNELKALSDGMAELVSECDKDLVSIQKRVITFVAGEATSVVV